MAEKIKTLKKKLADGSYQIIPLGADSINIKMSSGNDLQTDFDNFKSETTKTLEAKANSADVTKALATKADISTTYSKTEVNTMLGNKVDTIAMSNYYQKSQTYSRTEVDTKMSKLIDWEEVQSW